MASECKKMPRLIVNSHRRLTTNQRKKMTEVEYVLSNPRTLITQQKKVKYDKLKLKCSPKYLLRLGETGMATQREIHLV